LLTLTADDHALYHRLHHAQIADWSVFVTTGAVTTDVVYKQWHFRLALPLGAHAILHCVTACGTAQTWQHIHVDNTKAKQKTNRQ
jgi:hypothetical protein